MDSPEYYECDCTDFNHILRMRYFDNVSVDDPDFLYVEIHLRSKPFFERFWLAIKYAFGFRSKYGDFDEFCWSPETAKRFADHCMRYYNAATKE